MKLLSSCLSSLKKNDSHSIVRSHYPAAAVPLDLNKERTSRRERRRSYEAKPPEERNIDKKEKHTPTPSEAEQPKVNWECLCRKRSKIGGCAVSAPRSAPLAKPPQCEHG